MNSSKPPGLFCISFDSVAMSGIVVELLKIAKIFHSNSYQVYIDLGYEIKFDKKNFFKAYKNEISLYPQWTQLIKTIENPFYQYGEELIYEIFQKIIQSNKISEHDQNLINHYTNYICEKLITLWNKLNIKYILIENGTLPENIIFTSALYEAIERYGKQHCFSKYVLWRDHDLMWSSEANISKYGNYPYPNTIKFSQSKFISHVVLHEADYLEAMHWAPGSTISILRNNFSLENVTNSDKVREQFRKQHQIPLDGLLVARFTRIIPQKRIDRDLYLLNFLQKISLSKNQNINIYLAIAGNPNENISEFKKLKKLIRELNLDKFVFFIGNLKSIALGRGGKNHLKNLIIASDVCSFMTSYHYDSFGNPIAEAISLNKPYITTSYKQYQHVYGDLGYRGLVFPITEQDNEQITETFANAVYQLITDKNKMLLLAQHNADIMQRYQHADLSLKNKLTKLLDVTLNNE